MTFGLDSIYDDINLRHELNSLINDLIYARGQRELKPLESRSLDLFRDIKHKLDTGE